MKEIYTYSGIATGGKELEERQSNISKNKIRKITQKKVEKNLLFFFNKKIKG